MEEDRLPQILTKTDIHGEKTEPVLRMSVVKDVNLLHLPNESLLQILGLLNYKDLSSVSQVCKWLRAVTSDDRLWRWQCQYYYLVNSCSGESWMQIFMKMHKEYGRYIEHYRDIRGAWNKMETFLEKHCPTIFGSLQAGASEEELDEVEKKLDNLDWALPLDLRLSCRIHNGQDSRIMYSGLIGGGCLGEGALQRRSDVLLPMSINIRLPWLQYGVILLSSCFREGCCHFISVSEHTGLSLGSVYTSGSGMLLMEPASTVKCFYVAPSFKEWFCKYADSLEKDRYFVTKDCILRFYHEPSCVAVTSGITVKVSTCFMPELSNMSYCFAYRIVMSMDSNAPSHQSCQLQSRHWIIMDSTGKEEIVDGPGVVGEYPVMQPGTEYAWISCCSFDTPSGNMRGFFRMRNLITGSITQVECPCYHMEASPYSFLYLPVEEQIPDFIDTFGDSEEDS